jgi:SH3 domain protein
MKFILFFLTAFFLFSTVAIAETKYITENLAVMVRSEPENNRRIIAMPISGTPVKILETRDDGWTRVQLPDEKEGWMLSQYLYSGPPSKQIIEQMKKENSVLNAQSTELTKENAQLLEAKNTLEKAYNEEKNTADNLKTAYETLKSESTEYLTVKTAYEEARQQLDQNTKKVQSLERTVDKLQNDQRLWWLIAGSSAVLLGFLIGFLSRRPKRSSYLR